MNKITSVNIICLGNWNKKIFTPKWVSSKLFQLKPNTPFEGMINTDDMEFSYKHNGISLSPRDSILEIKLDKINKTSEKFACILLDRILSLLPHTPIKAIGINIGYTLKKTGKYKIVEKLNKLQFKIDDFNTSQLKLSKKLDDCLLNIIVDITDNEYIINFNFHYLQITKFEENTISSKKSIIKHLI